MARNEALGKEPTIDEINAAEMATFKGFSTTDGEVSKGEPTAEEKAALARMNAEEAAKQQTATGAAEQATDEGGEGEETDEQETPEEKTAREAREAKMTDKQKAAAALQKKIGGKPGEKPRRSAADRVAEINAATREMRQAQRDLETARATGTSSEIAALKAEIAQLKAGLTGNKSGATTVVDKDAPRPADYQYGELDAAYIRDV